ncbi:hypothetical protein [Leptolyngbya ohadii]|uniref:hypothetical protein n=1 Tax=Leptolyngbya ohadii TaxID=1962290 RepID=UPI000B59FAD8|nr:hypothetical protein [Leptolyngbya ohadii]
MQFSTQLLNLPLPACLCLILIAVGYGTVGWLLAAFQASVLIVLGTLGIILRLTQVGKDAIVLTNGWTVSVFAIAAVRKSWTPVWGQDIPYTNARLWAGVLILLWLWCTLLLFGSTLCQTALKTLGIPPRQTTLLLYLLFLLAIGLGSITYHLFSTPA